MSAPVLLLDPRDSVAVAVAPLLDGAVVDCGGRTLRVAEDIPVGHKLAVCEVAAGDPVLKYGQPIGRATQAVRAGQWVHTHNLRTALAGVETYVYRPRPGEVAAVNDGLRFEGFPRADGQVGIRNEVWILPTVGCVNEVAQTLARDAAAGGLPAGVDGVYAFPHPYGCSQLGGDLGNTRRILAGLAVHPNAGGVLILGLGCESNTLAALRTELAGADPERLRFLAVQEVGDERVEGRRLMAELIEHAVRFRRCWQPVARLRVGLKCGGSDAFSGITANPLVGAFADAWIGRGGTAVLTEVPEMFGAEALFLDRCATRAVFDECVAMLNGFKEYYLRHGQPVYENPSPGNKEGGLTTLEEKSLGCLQKGGSAPVAAVLPYAGRLARPGLNFLAGPGNDLVSVTALAAAGAQLILFTTGRGTPWAGPVPTLKIASTSRLARAKPHWVDFDAGPLLEGADRSERARVLLDRTLAVASGTERTRNEANGCREIAIWKDGVTL
jgi:altronate hydrolase